MFLHFFYFQYSKYIIYNMIKRTLFQDCYLESIKYTFLFLLRDKYNL